LGIRIGSDLVIRHSDLPKPQLPQEALTAEDHPLKKKMALNSATRLLVITVIAMTIAFLFKAHGGIAVLFGLAIFQALLVLSTSLPVMKKIRTEGLKVIDTESKD